MFTSTNYLTYSIFDNSSALCASFRPPSPLPALAPNVTDYCPVLAGSLAFGLTIPLSEPFSLKTLVTQIRLVDTSNPAHELTCLEVAATPMYTDTEMIHGPWSGIFWGTIVLTVVFWVTTGIGRISAAWDRGLGRSGNMWWMKIERTGFILASALSGEKFSVSPALLRFGTFLALCCIHMLMLYSYSLCTRFGFNHSMVRSPRHDSSSMARFRM